MPRSLLERQQEIISRSTRAQLVELSRQLANAVIDSKMGEPGLKPTVFKKRHARCEVKTICIGAHDVGMMDVDGNIMPWRKYVYDCPKHRSRSDWFHDPSWIDGAELDSGLKPTP